MPPITRALFKPSRQSRLRPSRPLLLRFGVVTLVAVAVVAILLATLTPRRTHLALGPLGGGGAKRTLCAGPGPATIGVDILNPADSKNPSGFYPQARGARLLGVSLNNPKGLKQIGAAVVPVLKTDALGLAQGYPGKLPSDMPWDERRSFPAVTSGHQAEVLVGLKRTAKRGRVGGFSVRYRFDGATFVIRVPLAVHLQRHCYMPSA